MKNHVAMYGFTKLKRGFCNKCKDWAFIIDKEFSCCDASEIEDTDKYKRMSNASGIKKKPLKNIQINILRNQKNKCLYCGITFGDIYYRNGKAIVSKAVWDHFVPFSYLQENPNSNWVAACRICNGIKGSKLFESVKDATDYVRYQRKKKEIYYEEDLSTVQNENCGSKEKSNIL